MTSLTPSLNNVQIERPTTDIALALSGGGVRAMAFHAGVLRLLAERGQMEAVTEVSSVSGGSLLAGIIYSQAGMAWPNSRLYLDKIHPAIRKLLTTQDLGKTADARLLFRPSNWRYLFQRTQVMAQTIQDLWGITGTLAQIPAQPRWSLNGTTAETGKRFQFQHDDFGDYEIGFAQAPDFPLASAMAASAAFPGSIGPLVLDTSKFQWQKRLTWNADANTAQAITPAFSELHIYDGGVYDNLGMEPLFDMGRQLPRGSFRTIVSDAGMPLTEGFKYGPLDLGRVGRLMSIMTAQTRTLRVRSFVNFLEHGGAGAYLGIDASPLTLLANRKIASDPAIAWLSDTDMARAQDYPTDLAKMSASDFDLIENHGYQTALVNQMAHAYLA
jgi:NTE family protein